MQVECISSRYKRSSCFVLTVRPLRRSLVNSPDDPRVAPRRQLEYSFRNLRIVGWFLKSWLCSGVGPAPSAVALAAAAAAADISVKSPVDTTPPPRALEGSLRTTNLSLEQRRLCLRAKGGGSMPRSILACSERNGFLSSHRKKNTRDRQRILHREANRGACTFEGNAKHVFSYTR